MTHTRRHIPDDKYPLGPNPYKPEQPHLLLSLLLVGVALILISSLAPFLYIIGVLGWFILFPAMLLLKYLGHARNDHW